LGKELPPLLTAQSVLALCAEVHTALSAALRAGDIDLDEYVAAVETAAYLTTWGQKLVDARVGEVASYLQYDSDTANKWAAQSYGPQNTLLGDAPAAAAFQLAKMAELKPVPERSSSHAAEKQNQGGRFRGSFRAGARGVKPTLPGEQAPGAGANRAPPRAR
jgi:hypothetical protein